ncbi:hypothetical protein D6C86_05853 [Aureobasidium pullulans]|uniref:Uncharacterized protein n=1 Tax=Aureobasidium pullulans TaxID=5580 RepID=A0A4S9UH10_AURPU|nr:hypothetical protein D6C94_06632 [Aureobasidium pullulans]THZ37790.1 hypothetical protein D6C87_08250 [Aureobasidium pullulans]THZ59195.1 hypothetical protein D6C86_05853 [Aureobasidium pullulans]
MARTKQVARKSIGDKAPRRRLTRESPKTLTTFDHTGNNILLLGERMSSHSGLSAFPFQVYILSAAADLATDDEFPDKLGDYIQGNDACIRFNENCRWHLEIYTLPQASILDCINHHEREKHHRKLLGRGPVMLNRKELLVVDNLHWESKGLLSIEYTAQFLGRDGSEREFENHVHHESGLDEGEELALPNLRQDLVVRRHRDADALVEVLNFIWYDEGHEWVLGPLMERNIALGWETDPDLIRYNTLPSTPVAKNITRGYICGEKRPREDYEDENQDEDDEDDEIFSKFDVEALATYGELCDPETAVPKSILHVIRRSIPSEPEVLLSLDLPNINIHESVDSVGTRCFDCQHISHTSSPVHFSYNLYVLGKKTYSPDTLFALLNCKFLAPLPWMLHVYEVGNLPEALSHYSTEMATRDVSRRLPRSYARPPEQPLPHVFLYIDEHTSQETGPRIVTMTDNNSTSPGTALKVTFPGGWEDAAQMIFTYIVLCAETPGIIALTRDCTPPSIMASVSLTDVHPLSGPCRSFEQAHLTLTLALDDDATRAVSIHTQDTILTPNIYLWDTFLRIIDVETNTEVPVPPPQVYHRESRAWSVEQLQALSFSFSTTSTAQHQILTLRPGEKVVRTVIFKDSQLRERYQDVLVCGRSYKIEMKPEQAAARWIWGDLEDDIGPLGSSRLQVLKCNNTAIFSFTGKSPTKECLSLPHCHLDE